MTAIHLLKTYCLPTLMYASENSVLVESDLRKINVIWNNCFRHIFSCCWRESVRPLQMFCHTLPLSYFDRPKQIAFLEKMHVSDNVILYTLSRHRFMALGSTYGVTSWN